MPKPRRATLVLGALAALAALPACNRVPVQGLEKSFTMTVTVGQGDGLGVPIDFLWVVDNSSSMCQEQVALAAAFDSFTSRLDEFLDADARVAVTTMDAACSPDMPGLVSGGGAFVHTAATAFSCTQNEYATCLSPDDCEAALGEGDWSCHLPLGTTSEVCTVAPNDEVLSYCNLHCESDDECTSRYGESYRCHSSGLTKTCRPIPPTEGCPSDLPPWLGADELDLFRCQASVGVHTAPCFRQEEGLKAATLALDKAGPNAAQAQDFLRDEAWLVVIFISDEDDCSLAPGAQVASEIRDRCQLLDTADEGGPLEPVSTYVNQLKGLKSDPTRIITAAIVGDALESEGEVTLIREAFMEAIRSPKDCHHNAPICASANGKASWGSRYQALTEGFGLHGLSQNLCADSDLTHALRRIAGLISSAVNRVCLPRAIHDDARLVVTRTPPGGETLTLEPGVDYRIAEDGGDDCRIDGEPRPALLFITDEPIPASDEIVVSYRADPLL